MVAVPYSNSKLCLFDFLQTILVQAIARLPFGISEYIHDFFKVMHYVHYVAHHHPSPPHTPHPFSLLLSVRQLGKNADVIVKYAVKHCANH